MLAVTVLKSVDVRNDSERRRKFDRISDRDEMDEDWRLLFFDAAGGPPVRALDEVVAWVPPIASLAPDIVGVLVPSARPPGRFLFLPKKEPLFVDGVGIETHV